MRLDKQLRDRCEAAGLDPIEMDRLFEQSASIGPVLSRIGEAEAKLFCAKFDEAKRNHGDASRSGGVGSRRWRTDSGRSFSMSVRLDHDEVEELRARAAAQNIGVSVLARSYIRGGLARPEPRRLD